ncbi:MAG: thermonuclease family protein [Candidatus Omnitrophota bacterium]
MRTVILISLFLLSAVPVRAQTYTVKKLITADTFELTNGVTVHMIGVKAPDEVEENKDFPDLEKLYGSSVTDRWIDNIAQNYLLTPGVQVILQYDVARRDASGNILAYVYRKRPLDESDFQRTGCWTSTLINGEEYLFINEYLLCSGAAAAVSEPPNLKYAEHFKTLHDNAVKYKSGNK